MQQLQYHSTGTEEPTLSANTHHNRKQKIPSQSISLTRPMEPEMFQTRNQNLRQLQACKEQLQTLKDQVEIDQKTIQQLEDTIIELKRELQNSSRENNRLYQQNQKNRQLLDKVKIDNKSMQMQIDKFRSERKIYLNNLTSLDTLKKQIAAEISQKNTIIQQQNQQIKRMERHQQDYKLKIEQLQKNNHEKQKQNKQLMAEVRNSLQKYLAQGNLIARMEYQLKETNQLNKGLKQKLYQMEKQRQDLFVKFGYDLNQINSSPNKSHHSPGHERSMLQIQSFMQQIQNLMDSKRQQAQRKQKSYEHLKIAIQCLQKQF